MFFSQTFLGRKGPLGTVWCAAHMQSRLKKSHYTSTDIPSTVDRIMFPEVPLALRMSSHLLVGVVRIYAKQVDILYDDCNVILVRLRKSFTSVDLNLPQDGQAPVQTITLPDTFDLDAMDLDDGFSLNEAVDHHLRSQEEITMLDQIPCETEPYVCISFDEDVIMDSQHLTRAHDTSEEPEDQNVVPPISVNNEEGFTSPTIHMVEQETLRGNSDALLQDLNPSDLPQMNDPGRSSDNSFDAIPEFEIMRDADQSSPVHPHILSPNRRDDILEPLPSFDQVMGEKEIISTISGNILPVAGQMLGFHPRSEPQVSVGSLQEGLVNTISPVSFAIRSTPRVQEPEQKPNSKPRPRKRKQLYDEAPVLSNRLMKEALKDTSGLLRKRTTIPHTSLGVWKLKNKLRKEQAFHDPSTTGLCSDLCDLYNDNYLSKKLKSLKEAHPDHEVVRSPGPEIHAPVPESSPNHDNAGYQTPTRDDVQDIEVLRNAANIDQQNTMSELIPSPIVTPSVTRDDISPSMTQNFRSTPPPVMEMDTPSVFSEEHTGRDFTVLSDVPEVHSEKEDDLFFLEADSSTPPASQGIQGVNSLSVRTRAVAQYLQRQSPSIPFSGEQSISLNKLVEGKTRKLCSRMFFETLVLKSNDLVDVEQQVPYGEITLTLTPALSKL